MKPLKPIYVKDPLDGRRRKPPYDGGSCPVCGKPLPEGYLGAISRRDNETEICSRCGGDEAIADWIRSLLGET